ncbi:electron transporter RnfB [Ahniella affigens]|uniref:Electron transporter RnfB n=1 Tax=Ahniella affigens TaxID=2021234 RepID=A0A2P1PZ29_9GAMM|nr:RnfABCDGE type electron transport complex subunit B [Ahniella affigens]AVQ00075.1 electron transporter RnfB [Ahniella affigens]
MPNLAYQIDAILPQTQCTKCGYQGCRPYAEAIASGEADINQCPPGGAAGIAALAALLDRAALPLNPRNGVEQDVRVAVIREAECIGCTKCIQACPVDAIVGANKLMHTVLLEDCTGCDLCIPPCPVDCIDMVPLAALGLSERRGRDDLLRRSAHYRVAFEQRNERLERRRLEQLSRLNQLSANLRAET